jgi:NAD+ diphosphatase
MPTKASFYSFACQNLRVLTITAAIYAQARSLIDWNARNPYCAACGHKTFSVNAGMKRICPPTDAFLLSSGSQSAERPPCVTRKGVHNLAFPRTDPTVIMAVLSASGSHILLGRQKRWPEDWYSTLAGFLEPAESVEEAVRREVWEEAGIHVGRVVIHSTQPWPYPANLMIGAIGQALPPALAKQGGKHDEPGKGELQQVSLKHDPELEDARWFSLDEVREAIEKGTSPLDGPGSVVDKAREGKLRLPPKTAIANQLLVAVVNGFAGETPKI